MKEILGKKLGMTRVFVDSGDAVTVTVIEAGPCPVIDVKTTERDGYVAYQVGFGEIRSKLVNKAHAGKFKKSGVAPTRYLRELRYDGEPVEVGAEFKVDMFNVGERVDVSGISRGLGFAGTMKRHNFSGAQATHGQKDRWRAPGSIGQSSTPSRVFKGMKMSGRMGKDKKTILNLEVIKVIESENLLLIKGSVPGFKGSLVKVRSTNRG